MDESGPAEKREGSGGLLHTYIVKLYDELDKEALEREIEEMRNEDPYLGPADLARRVIAEARASASSAGVLSGVTSVLPVIGGLVSIPALGTEVAYLLAQEVQLVLKVAALFGFNIRNRDKRLGELFAILGREEPQTAPTAAAGEFSQEALRKVASRGLIKLGQRAALRLGSRMLPLLGSVVGGLLNYSSIEEAGEMALRYYRRAQPES